MTEHLQTVAGLQEKEQQLGRQLAVTNRQLTVAQEEGEADRIRLMQAEDEILSLQVKYWFCFLYFTHMRIVSFHLY